MSAIAKVPASVVPALPSPNLLARSEFPSSAPSSTVSSSATAFKRYSNRSSRTSAHIYPEIMTANPYLYTNNPEGPLANYKEYASTQDVSTEYFPSPKTPRKSMEPGEAAILGKAPRRQSYRGRATKGAASSPDSTLSSVFSNERDSYRLSHSNTVLPTDVKHSVLTERAREKRVSMSIPEMEFGAVLSPDVPWERVNRASVHASPKQIRRLEDTMKDLKVSTPDNTLKPYSLDQIIPEKRPLSASKEKSSIFSFNRLKKAVLKKKPAGISKDMISGPCELTSSTIPDVTMSQPRSVSAMTGEIVVPAAYMQINHLLDDYYRREQDEEEEKPEPPLVVPSTNYTHSKPALKGYSSNQTASTLTLDQTLQKSFRSRSQANNTYSRRSNQKTSGTHTQAQIQLSPAHRDILDMVDRQPVSMGHSRSQSSYTYF
ncbi:hypothetical protein BABINDRAFT_160039 [Babjeviella inositovora NRRL Y-12698]|uniref:Uncharacterized protein n=1 Tax=Babjeviella inositovora NRRL Y-12698 TaxID=984486 RepID=A0A1E3QVV7_9ASCO|nr:uncharacterized protein BABINDRAFT_160039 [Babjeviella inositovora NRRL Y-12698]ODQ81799.1 hypothetical protein BABINDRAFT_160039 [Babjeviella inositovora NRRL Y-12698]